MSRVFAIIILLCIGYFIGGWVAVYYSWILESTYFSYASIVGGLASVVALFSFTRPALTKTDFQEIELDSLKSITETTEQLKELEQERAKTKEELGDLELQKKEMELLVKKASLALFLKEQYAHYEKRILEEVKSNSELSQSIAEAQEVSAKLAALQEEIETDPNVLQLKEIMAAASTRQPTFDESINDLSPGLKALFFLSRDLSRALTNILSTITAR